MRETVSRGGAGEPRSYVARCCCGYLGPWSEEITTAVGALNSEHGAINPEACADCGKATSPVQGRPWESQAPWRRYAGVEDERGARLVCADRAVCRQWQRSAEVVGRGDVVDVVVGSRETFEVTLNLSANVMEGATVSEAIAAFELARARSPRRWDEVAPTDRWALLAMVPAVDAPREASEWARTHAIPAALKAGATWQDVAGMLGYPSAEDAREWFLEQASVGDWPEDQYGDVETVVDEAPTSTRPVFLPPTCRRPRGAPQMRR